MEYVILFFSIINLLLGLIIVLRPPYTKSNVSFFIFALLASAWTFNNFYLRLVPEVEVLRISYGIGILVATAGLVWTRFFLDMRLTRWLLLLFPVSLVFLATTLLTTLVIERIDNVELFGYSGQVGWLFPAYSTYLGLLIGLTIYSLVAGIRQAATEVRRKQILLVLAGAVFFTSVTFGVSFVVPTFFNTFNLTVFDNLSFSVFLISIVLAILKYKLFNLKVIATELFVAGLWIFTLARALIAPDIQDKIIGGALFAFTAVVGLLLIRSVIKEVEQREEIQNLYKELEIKNQKLTELDKLKSQFLSIATHELRTPLTIVRNFVSLMLDGSYGKVPPAAEEAGRQVFERVNDMAHSVDTYLNVSKIEQGKISYTFAPADLTHLTTLAVEGLKANAAKKSLELSLTIKPGAEKLMLQLDASKITEVLINLIDNSIKYTPKGSVAVVVEKVVGKARVTIKDTGVGMTDKTRANLFKLFSPGEDSKKINPASTGVGLYVSMAHVLAHKGTLMPSSEGPGKGSTFTLELPINS